MNTTVARLENEKIQSNRSLPKGWRWVKLGEVCEIIMGQSPPSNTYRNVSEGLSFYQGKADFGTLNPVARIWCVEPIKIALCDDILISVRAPVGPTNLANEKCCIGRGLAAIRIGQKISLHFLYNWLKLIEPVITDKGSGSTFQAINKSELETLEIPLPPLPEQKRIAAILNEQMAHVEKARKATKQQLEAAKALPAAYLRSVFNSPEAQGWQWVKLEGVCIQDRKIIEPSSAIAQSLPYLSLEHVESGSGKILKHPTGFVENEGMSTSFAFDERHVLYGKLRPYLNKVALPDFSGRCTTELIPLLPNANIYREYVCWVLRRPETINEAMRGKTGSRMPRASMDELLQLLLPLPPLPEQKRIAAILNEQMVFAEKLTKHIDEQLDTINKLPAALLKRAFNGEL